MLGKNHESLKLPENDSDFSTRLRLIKRAFSMKVIAPINARKEKLIWQRRFWEHLIKDADDWRNHMDYIHYNPVKHRYVNAPIAWPHSSFKYWVEKELYTATWGETEPENIGKFYFE